MEFPDLGTQCEESTCARLGEGWVVCGVEASYSGAILMDDCVYIMVMCMLFTLSRFPTFHL